MNFGLESTRQIGNVFENVKNAFSQERQSLHHMILPSQFCVKTNYTIEYLQTIEPHISKQLISSKNYSEIKNLANHLHGNITTFFGFETRLNSTSNRSDYLLAVSSKNGEREALLQLIKSGNLPETFMKKDEWKKVGDLVEAWSNPQSSLNNNIRGLWLEFDTANEDNATPIPGIFLHTIPLRIDTPEDITKVSWLTREALPLLSGGTLSETIEQHLIDALTKLPKNAVVFQAAVMLSREETGIRIVAMRIPPHKIVSYLKEIGWTGNKEELSSLIDEITAHASRINVQIQIDNKGISPRIGLECNFSPDRLHEESKWSDFLDYLIDKNLCLPEKKNMLLEFVGVNQEDPAYEFDFISYKAAAKMQDSRYSSALVRYLNHIKISYNKEGEIDAKAYPGIRLFGREKDVSYQ